MQTAAARTVFGHGKNVYNEDFFGNSLAVYNTIENNYYDSDTEDGGDGPDPPEFDDGEPDEFEDPEVHNDEEEHNGPEEHNGEEEHNGPEEHNGEEEHNGPEEHNGEEEHNGHEEHNGEEEHNGPEHHNGEEEHNGPEHHNGEEDHHGPEHHFGEEDHHGTETHTGDLNINGNETHNGEEEHNGPEEHNGTETHNGEEAHHGIETHTGDVTNSGNTTFNGPTTTFNTGPVTVNSLFSAFADAAFGAGASFASTMSLQSTGSLSALSGASIGFDPGVDFSVGADTTFTNESSTVYENGSTVTNGADTTFTPDSNTVYENGSTVTNGADTTFTPDSKSVFQEGAKIENSGDTEYKETAKIDYETNSTCTHHVDSLDTYLDGSVINNGATEIFTTDYEASGELANAAHNVMSAVTDFVNGASLKINTGAELDIAGSVTFNDASVVMADTIFAFDSTSSINANNFMPRSTSTTMTGTVNLDINATQVQIFNGIIGGQVNPSPTAQVGSWFVIVNDCNTSITVSDIVFASGTNGMIVKVSGSQWALVGSSLILGGGGFGGDALSGNDEGVFIPKLKFPTNDSPVEPTTYTTDGTFIKQRLNSTKFAITLNCRITVSDYSLPPDAVQTSPIITDLPFAALRTVYPVLQFSDSSPEGFNPISSTYMGELTGTEITFTGGGLTDISPGDIWSFSCTYITE